MLLIEDSALEALAANGRRQHPQAAKDIGDALERLHLMSQEVEMRRMDTLGDRGRSDFKSAHVFCAGCRLARPGSHGVVGALRSYQDWVQDRVGPGEAFDFCLWRADA